MVRKSVGVVGLCVVVMLSAAAHAQKSQADPNRRAYGYALRCFSIAAGTISDTRASAAEVTAARASSRRSYDAAHRMGGLMGLSPARIDEDITATNRAEAALVVRDSSYAQQRRAECARLGL